MVPSKNELLCIAFSNKLKEEALKRRISQLRANQIPIFITPTKYIKDLSIEKLNDKWWKQTLYYSMLFILYLTYALVMFIVGIGYKIFEKNTLSAKISSLKSAYTLELDNNEVSEIKLFSSLWGDKGLNPYSSTKEEQRQCIYEWFKILYGQTTELDRLAKVIQERQSMGSQIFREENPNGHVTMVPTEHLLPSEIDQQFGHYIP